MIIVFACLILAVAAHALVAEAFMLLGHPNPWQAATPWWIVYGSLIDIGCLVLRSKLARREGVRLFDLIIYQGTHLGRDLLLGVGFVILYIALATISEIFSGIWIYGKASVPAVMVPLPLWGTMYSLIICPSSGLSPRK